MQLERKSIDVINPLIFVNYAPIELESLQNISLISSMAPVTMHSPTHHKNMAPIHNPMVEMIS
jgi:hypothetical protein